MGFMRDSSGFSLIELIVVVAIVAIIATIALPRLKKPDVRVVFLKKLNALTELGYTQALATGQMQRLFFDFTKKTVTLESAQQERSAAGEVVYKPTNINYLKTAIEWPQEFELRSFYINEKVDPGTITTIYFIIMPQGFTQRVVITILDTVKDDTFIVVLNPFYAQFEVQDEASKA